MYDTKTPSDTPTSVMGRNAIAKDPVLGYSTRNNVFEQDGNAGAALVLSRWKDRGPVAPLSELCEARGEAALRD
ncbi:MAG: hypothetical protein GY725_17200 [bacterium]|nr:hypothetical protein [bacterium]